MSLTHKNHTKSRSDYLTDTFKNACLMSIISATLYEQYIKLILEVNSALFPDIDLETALQLMARRRKQYVI